MLAMAAAFECAKLTSHDASRQQSSKKDIFNLLLFQMVWFATVLGAAKGTLVFGLAGLGVFLLAHYYLAVNPWSDLKLAGIAVVMGLLIETYLLRIGLLEYVQIGYSMPIAPLWILILWVGFALTLNGCLRWLHGRYLLAAILGALGAPASYFGGIKLGAATTDVSLVIVLGVVAAIYAVITPLLLMLAGRLTRAAQPG